MGEIGLVERCARRGAVAPDETAGLLYRAVHIETETSDGANFRTGVCGVHQRLQPAAVHDGVVVQEYHVVTPAIFTAALHAPPKPRLTREESTRAST